MQNIVSELRKELKANIDDKTKAGAQRYFKENIKCYGNKTSVVTRIGKEYFQKIKNKNKKEIFAICEELLRSGYNEEAWIAAAWTDNMRKEFTPGDFKIFEKWVENYIDNWAKCDTLCNHAIGAFIEMYPQYLPKLKRWTKSKNRFVRRAASVTLILPARRGNFLKDIFEISDMLLLDQDDLVQKGYGWMLKEASRKHREEVFDYVIKNKAVMPRTALRYAIEKMPDKLRKKAMAR